jgi:hypothetical protein
MASCPIQSTLSCHTQLPLWSAPEVTRVLNPLGPISSSVPRMQVCRHIRKSRWRSSAWVLALIFFAPIFARGESALHIKPYRVLVVVEQWNDPASALVDSEKDEFQPVAALLRAWSIPFDIFRLDQQHLDASYLLDRSGTPRYGTVLWLADSPSYAGQDMSSLEEAVHAGSSLLVERSRFLDPALKRLLGLRFKEAYTSTSPLQTSRPHFITHQLAEQKMERLDVSGDESMRWGVEVRDAEVLITQRPHPVLTLAHPVEGTSAIWMGVSPDLMALRDSPYWRQLFFRSLVWSLGYVIQPDIDYSRRLVVTFDDWGASEKSFSALFNWHFPTLSEEQIRERLIEPLQKHHAVAIADVVDGFVNRRSRHIESPWVQKFTDDSGFVQDYTSTAKGLKAALAAGCLEIASHGWTHMQPDLESPPGPWWTSDLIGEASAIGWVAEFEDWRRNKDIPAIVQLTRMKYSRQALRQDFGELPLSLLPGEYAWSKSYADHTGRLAARAGFGIFHVKGHYFYLDPDLILDMVGIGPEVGHGYDHPLEAAKWPAHPDGPVFMTAHDRDLAFQPDFVDRLFTSLPAGTETLSMNRYVGILHARISSTVANGWELAFEFPEDYGIFFKNHTSRWRISLSAPLRDNLKALGKLGVAIDGKPSKNPKAIDLKGETLHLELPEGLGRHTWKLRPVEIHGMGE